MYSGSNALKSISGIVKGKYHKAAVFTDQGITAAGLLGLVTDHLKEGGLEIEVLDNLAAEPSYHEAQEAVNWFRKTGADLIVAVGGGSVMDAAKLASIAAEGENGVARLLDDPLKGRKLVETMMVPTTAGTGSEATPNSIVAVPEKELKVGIVNEAMLPDYVVLDGAMIKKLPKKIAASTGVDALAHGIECFTSKKANPFSNLFAMEALKLIFPNIEKACCDENAMEEKNNMLLAAFYAGAAITASGTTAVHALSYPLGGRYHIPHGVANAMLLLPVMEFNRPTCLNEFAAVYDELKPGARAESKEEKADWVLGRMERIIKNLEIPTSLTEFGIGMDDLDDLVKAGMEVKRLLNNNKRIVTAEDARKLYFSIMKTKQGN